MRGKDAFMSGSGDQFLSFKQKIDKLDPTAEVAVGDKTTKVGKHKKRKSKGK